MSKEFLRGSLVACALLLLSLFSLFARIIPTYYFAAMLLAWALLAAYKLIAFRTRASSDEEENFAYWTGARFFAVGPLALDAGRLSDKSFLALSQALKS